MAVSATSLFFSPLRRNSRWAIFLQLGWENNSSAELRERPRAPKLSLLGGECIECITKGINSGDAK